MSIFGVLFYGVSTVGQHTANVSLLENHFFAWSSAEGGIRPCHCAVRMCQFRAMDVPASGKLSLASQANTQAWVPEMMRAAEPVQAGTDFVSSQSALKSSAAELRHQMHAKQQPSSLAIVNA